MDTDKNSKLLSVFICVHLWIIFLLPSLRFHKQPRCVFFVEFEEEYHTAGFGGEGLGAVGEVDGPVEVVVGLDERGRHCQRVVEIGERTIWKFAPRIQNSLGGGLITEIVGL